MTKLIQCYQAEQQVKYLHLLLDTEDLLQQLHNVSPAAVSKSGEAASRQLKEGTVERFNN